MIQEFGEDVLSVIEDDPERLTKIKGVSPRRARQISAAFRQQMGVRRLAEFLTRHQLPLELAVQLSLLVCLLLTGCLQLFFLRLNLIQLVLNTGLIGQKLVNQFLIPLGNRADQAGAGQSIGEILRS